MPDVRNCRRCGKIFNYLSGPPICLDCKNADEEIFKKVKEYIYDNPGATLSQVATDVNVSVEKIKMFLKEGRLEIMDDSNIILECERCGKSIKTGRFCRECKQQVSSDILENGSRKQEKRLDDSSDIKRNGIAMRYLNKDV